MKLKILKLFLLFFMIYFLTASGHFYVGDEVTRFQLTKSIVENRSLAIDIGYGMRSKNEKLYSKYGIGTSICAIPLYIFGKFITIFVNLDDKEKIILFSVSIFNQFVASLCCCLFFLICWKRIKYSFNSAMLLTFIFGLCTPLWHYSKTFFAEPLIMLCLLGLFYFDGYSIITGIIYSIALLTRIDSIIVFPFLVYFYNKKTRNKKLIFRFLLPILLTIIFLIYYNYYRFGNIFEFGYGGESFSSPIWNGIYGLIFSSGKGLLLFMPILVFYFIFINEFYKLNKKYGVISIGIPLIYLLFFSRWNLWGGDLSWGPRYLIPILPFLIFPIGICFSNIKSYKKVFLIFMIFIFLSSLFIQFLGTALNFHTYTDLFYAVKGRDIKARDPLALIHFLPEYSPIRGHYQMLKFIFIKNYCPTILNPDCNNTKNEQLRKIIKLDFWILRIKK